MAAPERHWLAVDGFPATEAFVLNGAADPSAGSDAAAAADVSFVVFPGNPGIAGCYTLLLERLAAEWGHCSTGSARFIAVSYAGHVAVPPAEAAGGDDGGGGGGPGPGPARQKTRFTLEQQVEHKLRFLARHVVPRTRRELILIGHSIGAHLAVQCAKRLRRGGPQAPPPLRVAPVLLTPFLSSNAPACPRQRAVRRLAALHAAAGAAATLAGRVLGALSLPEAVQLALAARVSGADHDAACRAIAGLLAPGVVDSALHLAKDEFAALPQGVSGLPLGDLELCGEACVIAGPDDMWFPRAHYDAIAGRFRATLAAAAAAAAAGGAGGGGGEEAAAAAEAEAEAAGAGGNSNAALAAIWDPSISHLFGCSARETVAVAAHVARWWDARSRST
jgi:hypothetical protein